VLMIYLTRNTAPARRPSIAPAKDVQKAVGEIGAVLE
jgi:hypothetical protein